MRPETNTPNRSPRTHCQFSETVCLRESSQIRAYLAATGGPPVAWDCVVDPAGTRTANQIVMKWSRRGPSAACLGAYATASGRFFGHNADTKSTSDTSLRPPSQVLDIANLVARPKRFELMTPKFVVWCSLTTESIGRSLVAELSPWSQEHQAAPYRDATLFELIRKEQFAYQSVAEADCTLFIE